MKMFKCLFSKHNMELYIYYNQWNFIYRCTKCHKMVFYDMSVKIKIEDQKQIEHIRTGICKSLKIGNDLEIINRTKQMVKSFSREGDLKSFIEKMKNSLDEKRK